MRAVILLLLLFGCAEGVTEPCVPVVNQTGTFTNAQSDSVGTFSVGYCIQGAN